MATKATPLSSAMIRSIGPGGFLPGSWTWAPPIVEHGGDFHHEMKVRSSQSVGGMFGAVYSLLTY